ncbi:MAG: bacteriohemerythrin [Proteobacteria bacterium]|nr:bacteriohemerythrin [Pseudomonadota bacterium]
MNSFGNYMPFMQWEQAYSVNIRSIDDQHKKMIDLINELYDCVKGGSERERLNETFLRLSVYTVKHFIYEEALFKKHAYSDLFEHKKKHDELAEQLTEFHKKYSVQKEEINEELINFFKETMFEHITTCDREYIEYMSDHGIK